MSSIVGAKSELFAGRRPSSPWRQPAIHLAEREYITWREVGVEEEVGGGAFFYCTEKH